MDEGETNKQLHEENEQLKRENELLKAKVIEFELLKAKIKELEARLAQYENAHNSTKFETWPQSQKRSG